MRPVFHWKDSNSIVNLQHSIAAQIDAKILDQDLLQAILQSYSGIHHTWPGPYPESHLGPTPKLSIHHITQQAGQDLTPHGAPIDATHSTAESGPIVVPANYVNDSREIHLARETCPFHSARARGELELARFPSSSSPVTVNN